MPFPKKPEFSITVPSDTQLLRMVVDLTKHIAALNQFPPIDAQKISLAVDEAVTNVIEHSYKNKKDKELTIEFFFGTDGLKINVIYTGIPPEIDEASDINLNKLIKAKKMGGLGVALMRKIMDSVDYKTTNGIHCCEMIKWQKAI